MNQPEHLLAYRKVYFENQWHLKCINCGPSSESFWQRPEAWRLCLPSGAPVVVALPPPVYETSSLPRGPDEVYGRDEVLNHLDSSTKIHAFIAKCEVVVVTDDDFSDVSLPQFLSMDGPATEHFEAIVRFSSPLLQSLPDVQEYERRMRMSAAVDEDLAWFLPKNPKAVRIPVGLVLPGAIEAAGTETPVVYAIKEWRSDSAAVIDCFACGAVDFKQNANLRRRAPALRTNEVLGAVIEFLPV